MKIQMTITAVSTLLLMACATTHPGNPASSVESSSPQLFKVSAENIDAPFEHSYQLVEVTIENNSDNWVRFNRSHLEIPGADNYNIQMVAGSDLVDWQAARASRRLKDQTNRDVTTLAVLGGAMGIMMVGGIKNDPGLMAAGTIIPTGVTGWTVADAVHLRVAEANQSQKVPDTHILRPFTVPAKMFLRRWFVVSKPVDFKVRRAILTLETSQNQTEKFELVL